MYSPGVDPDKLGSVKTRTFPCTIPRGASSCGKVESDWLSDVRFDFDWFNQIRLLNKHLIGCKRVVSGRVRCARREKKMAAISSADNRDSPWEKGIKSACDLFGITSFYDKQLEALKKFFEKRDVFVNLPTCYG